MLHTQNLAISVEAKQSGNIKELLVRVEFLYIIRPKFLSTLHLQIDNYRRKQS